MRVQGRILEASQKNKITPIVYMIETIRSVWRVIS